MRKKYYLATIVVFYVLFKMVGIQENFYATKLDSNINGLVYYQDEWYFFKDGQIDFSYNGLGKNDYGTWYIENGKVNFGINGLAQCGDGWYLFKAGEVETKKTTLVQNDYGWWYVQNGQIDFSYNGLGKNDYGTWYIQNGEVNFGINGLAQCGDGWYLFKAGEVETKKTTLAQNDYGWWYVQNGKVDFSYNGLGKNDYGTWYIQNGEVNFGINGLAQCGDGWYLFKAGEVETKKTGLVKNDKDFLCCQNGEINFNYNGKFSYKGYNYTIKNGKAVFETQADKEAISKVIAEEIANEVLAKGKTDLEKVYIAANHVAYYCAFAEYTTEGNDYQTAYGVFIKGEYSSAGATRALGLVLDNMGYSWKHINENKNEHQWCELYIDGQKGWADGMGADCGYGEWGENSYASQNENIEDEQKEYITNIDDYYAYLNKKFPKLENGKALTVVVKLDKQWTDDLIEKYTDTSKITEDANYGITVSSYNKYITHFMWIKSK